MQQSYSLAYMNAHNAASGNTTPDGSDNMYLTGNNGYQSPSPSPSIERLQESQTARQAASPRASATAFGNRPAPGYRSPNTYRAPQPSNYRMPVTAYSPNRPESPASGRSSPAVYHNVPARPESVRVYAPDHDALNATMPPGMAMSTDQAVPGQAFTTADGRHPAPPMDREYDAPSSEGRQAPLREPTVPEPVYQSAQAKEEQVESSLPPRETSPQEQFYEARSRPVSERLSYQPPVVADAESQSAQARPRPESTASRTSKNYSLPPGANSLRSPPQPTNPKKSSPLAQTLTSKDIGRITPKGDQGLVRDPQFWKRFSTAVHLAEKEEDVGTPPAVLAGGRELQPSDSWLKQQEREKKRARRNCWVVVLVLGFLAGGICALVYALGAQ